MRVSVESTDKFNNSTLAVGCSEEKFGTTKPPVYQVLHRTTVNEAQRIVQQTRGQGMRSVARNREEVRSEEHV